MKPKERNGYKIARWKEVRIKHDGFLYKVEYRGLHIGNLVHRHPHNGFQIQSYWGWAPDFDLAKYLGLPISYRVQGVSLVAARRLVKIMLFAGIRPKFQKPQPHYVFDFPSYTKKILNNYKIPN